MARVTETVGRVDRLRTEAARARVSACQSGKFTAQRAQILETPAALGFSIPVGLRGTWNYLGLDAQLGTAHNSTHPAPVITEVAGESHFY